MKSRKKEGDRKMRKAKKTTTKKPEVKVYDGPILVLKTTKAGGEPHCNGCLLYTSPSPRDA